MSSKPRRGFNLLINEIRRFSFSALLANDQLSFNATEDVLDEVCFDKDQQGFIWECRALEPVIVNNGNKLESSTDRRNNLAQKSSIGNIY